MGDAEHVARHPATLAFVRGALPMQPSPSGRSGSRQSGLQDRVRQGGRRTGALVLLKALRSQRQLGGPGYPSTLRRLAELAGNLPLADAVVAMGKPTFREAVVVAANLPEKVTAASGKKFLDAHLTLRENIDRLAGRRRRWSAEFGLAGRQDDCAVPRRRNSATKLLGKAAGNPQSDLRERFVRLTNEKLALPARHQRPSVGINEKGKPLLFLAEDLFRRPVLSHRGAGRGGRQKRASGQQGSLPATPAAGGLSNGRR